MHNYGTIFFTAPEGSWSYLNAPSMSCISNSYQMGSRFRPSNGTKTPFTYKTPNREPTFQFQPNGHSKPTKHLATINHLTAPPIWKYRIFRRKPILSPCSLQPVQLIGTAQHSRITRFLSQVSNILCRNPSSLVRNLNKPNPPPSDI